MPTPRRRQSTRPRWTPRVMGDKFWALWYDASALTGLNDGDAALFTDLSGNGRNTTQATTTKRPLFKLGVANGLPMLLFDGTDDSLSTTYTAALGDFTIVA